MFAVMTVKAASYYSNDMCSATLLLHNSLFLFSIICCHECQSSPVQKDKEQKLSEKELYEVCDG